MGKPATQATLIALVTSAFGCSPFGGANEFKCTDDSQCTGAPGGRCEMDGFCSFADGSCPSGQRYGELAGSSSNDCVGGGPLDDGGVDMPVDMPPDPTDVCFGSTGGLAQPCWTMPEVPSGAVNLTGTIDTDNSAQCSTTVKNVDVAKVCVIAGGTVAIQNGQLARVTGSKALVVVSTTGAITLDGPLDAASHRGDPALGPAQNPTTCDAGTPADTSGGGAGGSFGGQGGDGGNGVGVANTGGTAGNPAAAIVALTGGCNGQDGKEGDDGANSRGLGGPGGGAVYLIGKTSVVINAAGSINASGAGATGGISGSAGGGGGGSGGLIGIDTPTLTNTGAIFARGGGGGAGSGTNGAGGNGGDPSANTAGSAGVGGTGAPGGVGGTADDGGNGGNSVDRGGGGGGGGTGVIKLFGGATGNGTISPAAS